MFEGTLFGTKSATSRMNATDCTISSKSIGEVLEKGELRRPDDPAWAPELESSRVVEYDGDTFHPIQCQ